jgi:hypothetical protein
MIVYQGYRHDALQLEVLKAVAQAGTRAFRRQAFAPVPSGKGIEHFDVRRAWPVAQAAMANELVVWLMDHGPRPKAIHGPGLDHEGGDACIELGPGYRAERQQGAHHVRVSVNALIVFVQVGSL